MRSLRTPAAVLLAMLTAFLLCCGLTAEPHYVFGMGHPDPPVQFASLNTYSVKTHHVGAARMRRLPLLLERQLIRLFVFAASAVQTCAGLSARLHASGSRRRLMAFYVNSPKLAPPAYPAC